VVWGQSRGNQVWSLPVQLTDGSDGVYFGFGGWAAGGRESAAPSLPRPLEDTSAAHAGWRTRVCSGCTQRPRLVRGGGRADVNRVRELRYCGGCRGVMYCGRACQRAHWRAGHRRACALTPRLPRRLIAWREAYLMSLS
jgi:hypothetical protein